MIAAHTNEVGMKTKNGLNDQDQIFVTVALWIALGALFATALSLPQLPDMVAIFYKTSDMDISYYSKYNDLFIALTSLIPLTILIVMSELKKHGRARHNFPSVLLFCIMLSICFGGVSIYGIFKQFEAVGSKGNTDVNTVIALIAAFALSLVSSLIPTVVHSPAFIASGSRRSVAVTYIAKTLDESWSVGMYLFLLTGVGGSFIPGYFTYIPIAVAVVGYVVFIAIRTRIAVARGMEDVLIETIDSNTAV